jgi:hypothetical protein
MLLGFLCTHTENDDDGMLKLNVEKWSVPRGPNPVNPRKWKHARMLQRKEMIVGLGRR